MNSNTLEFFVKMKDLMSGGLAKLAQNSQNTFTKIKGHINNAVASTKFMANSIDELRYKLKQVNEVRFGTVMKSEFRQATREAKRLENQISRLEGRSRHGGSLGGVFGSLLPAIGLAAVTSFGASSVHAAMDFQASKIKYGVLTGSQQTGDMLAGQLRQLKQDTIMGPAVYGAAEKMLGFGIASSKVLPDLKMLGDISMGDASKLQRLTLAFSEVEAAGKMNSRRLLQFVNAGFNPLLEISRTTGKSMEFLTEQMRKGGISAAMLEDAFKSATSEGGRFNGMLDKVAETPLGRLKKLQGQFNSLKIDIGEALMPLASLLMKVASFLMKHIELVEAAGAAWASYKIISIASLVEVGAAADIALGPIGLIAAAIGAITFAWISAKQAEEDYNNIIKANADKNYNTEREGIIGDIRNLKKLNPKLTDAQATKRIFDSESDLLASSMTENAHKIMDAQKIYDKATGAKSKASAFRNLENLQGMQTNFLTQKQALEDLKAKGVTAADIKGVASGGDKTKTDSGGGGKDVATGITGGGPRVININGVKFTDKIEFHVANMIEGTEEAERKLQEMFLRTLNSGASVQ